MEPLIHVKDLHKEYKSHKRGQGFVQSLKSLFKRKTVVSHAVNNVRFNIMPGEIVGFVGPNGAGKSTTIKMLTGILYPTRGEVSVLGFTPWDDRRSYVKNIGVVFGQKSQLWWDLPPIDAFYLNKDIYGIPESEFNKRLKTMTRLLGLTEVMHRPTRSLSLGERMKCEFVMALLHNPPVLFLDEPTIGVDALAKENIHSFLKAVNKEYGTTMLITTHDMNDIEEMCKRIIIIDEGKIIYDGDIITVKNQYVKWKTVDVEYAQITNAHKLAGLLKQGSLQVNRPGFKSIRFHKQRVSIPEMVAKLMTCGDVIDLTVHEDKLEHVIKEIYGAKRVKAQV